jgi:hypothetical protein
MHDSLKRIGVRETGSFMEGDHIVLATGATSNHVLAQSLKGKIPEILEVVDCIEPRRLMEAIHEGAKAGLQI